MFSSVSWLQFLGGLLVVVIAYYGAVFLIFRKPSARAAKPPPPPADIPPPVNFLQGPLPEGINNINRYTEIQPAGTEVIDLEETDPEIVSLDNFLNALEEAIQHKIEATSHEEVMEKLKSVAAGFKELENSPFKQMAEDQVIRSLQSGLAITITPEQAATIWNQPK